MCASLGSRCVHDVRRGGRAFRTCVLTQQSQECRHVWGNGWAMAVILCRGCLLRRIPWLASHAEGRNAAVLFFLFFLAGGAHSGNLWASHSSTAHKLRWISARLRLTVAEFSRFSGSVRPLPRAAGPQWPPRLGWRRPGRLPGGG